MSRLPLTGAGPSAGGIGVEYLLRATFTADDQGYSNGQVLDTDAEGVEDGQLTVVEVDGTLSLSSNQCRYVGSAAVDWGELGYYSQAITRVLGRGLLTKITADNTTNWQAVGWQDAGDVSTTNRVYWFYLDSTASIVASVYDGAGSPHEYPTVGGYAISTAYSFCILLGGNNVDGQPYYSGQTKSSYGYGAWFMVKGGSFSTWTLLWVTKHESIATLYAMATARQSASGYLDDVKVPDLDMSSIQAALANFSSFTASNGTSLDAITPEAGGTWTEHSGTWEIQSNQAEQVGSVSAYLTATIDSDISDVLVDIDLWTGATATATSGLVVRLSDDSNYWMVTVQASGNIWSLYECNGGEYTLRASAAATINVNTTYQIRVICDGQTISCFLDGGNKISYASASHNETQTRHGLVAYDARGCRHDNFFVLPRTDAVYDSTLDAV